MPKILYFHLLGEDGKIEKTVRADQSADEAKFELDAWMSIEGKACLVERISFDKEKINIVLKPIHLKLH